MAQAGTGTNQIGRFDIVVDDDTNSIVEYSWRLIPINDKLAKPDPVLQDYILSLQEKVDHKYNTLLCKLAVPLTHPARTVETALGNLVADALAEHAGCDVMLVGSGSIRVESVGPLVTLKDLLAMFPYDDSITRHEVSGAALKRAFAHFMRAENRTGEGVLPGERRGAGGLLGGALPGVADGGWPAGGGRGHLHPGPAGLPVPQRGALPEHRARGAAGRGAQGGDDVGPAGVGGVPAEPSDAARHVEGRLVYVG